MTGYLTINQLKNIGVIVLGNNIKVSEFVRIYNPYNLILHDNIRIDDFTIISCNGRVEIFNYVHIGSNCLISCSTNIIFHNYSCISSGVKLFGATDDYSGNFMTNAVVPDKYKNVTKGDIILEEHVLVGSGSVILPNVILHHGTSVGALSLIKHSTEPWKIYVGSPARPIKDRSKKCLELQKIFELENKLV